MFLSKRFSVFALIFTILLGALNPAQAAKSGSSSLRTFGDYAQIVNPLFVAGLASQEIGFGHFAIIYGQSWVSMHGIKLISKSAKWSASKRPNTGNKKDRYEGMPSGHTNSAWVAASYVRMFSEHKYLSIPLYATAIVTGCSRVKAKEHTTLQVIAGAALAELVTYINSRLDWSDEYQSTNFYFGGDEVSARFEFRF
ncbi:MAG: hypothetical protein COA94_06205 [Rickettsiales bacterium]|nr:MAG: hypothetical protein COA94_06205 [Rickettsiales bacterium]